MVSNYILNSSLQNSVIKFELVRELLHQVDCLRQATKEDYPEIIKDIRQIADTAELWTSLPVTNHI